MLTALENEQSNAFKLWADDFIAKPPRLSELFARINAQLRLKNYIEEITRAEEVLFTLATIIEIKDKYTEEHTERVARVSLKMGEVLGLSKKEMDDLRKGALLHDIGKVGIPDRILQKREPLTPEEWEKLKEHVIIGEKICSSLKSLRGALPIIRHHHEHWDGSGYPDGLKGFDIPFLARIVALADAYDAMNSDRPYRPKLEKEKIIEIFEDGAGKQWDPSLTHLLIDLIRRGEV
jgi:putative two-component system response regulator